MENEKITIVNLDGTRQDVNIVTFLVSKKNDKKYIVYTKNETQGQEQDRVIYISRLKIENNMNKLEEIEDSTEWIEVQKLLKQIANA